MGRISSLSERILIKLVEDGQWEIDSEGRIWRTKMRHGLKSGNSQLVNVARRRVEHRLPQGYLQVRAMINGVRVHGMAHRLVWQHFNGDIPIGHEINHDNGLKDDNRPSNLICGSGGENVEHAHRNGLLDQHGQKNPAAKLTDNQIAQIRLAYSKGGYTMKQLGERFGVSFKTISKIVRGERRAKQGGPTLPQDNRHCASDRDPTTGRFLPNGACHD
jgi:hypothetical protein